MNQIFPKCSKDIVQFEKIMHRDKAVTIFCSLNAQLTQKESYSHARLRHGHTKTQAACSLWQFCYLGQDCLPNLFL